MPYYGNLHANNSVPWQVWAHWDKISIYLGYGAKRSYETPSHFDWWTSRKLESWLVACNLVVDLTFPRCHALWLGLTAIILVKALMRGRGLELVEDIELWSSPCLSSQGEELSWRSLGVEGTLENSIVCDPYLLVSRNLAIVEKYYSLWSLLSTVIHILPIVSLWYWQSIPQFSSYWQDGLVGIASHPSGQWMLATWVRRDPYHL